MDSSSLLTHSVHVTPMHGLDGIIGSWSFSAAGSSKG